MQFAGIRQTMFDESRILQTVSESAYRLSYQRDTLTDHSALVDFDCGGFAYVG